MHSGLTHSMSTPHHQVIRPSEGLSEDVAVFVNVVQFDVDDRKICHHLFAHIFIEFGVLEEAYQLTTDRYGTLQRRLTISQAEAVVQVVMSRGFQQRTGNGEGVTFKDTQRQLEGTGRYVLEREGHDRH
ncbi:hypothetical protein D3C86_1765620 [compost metagenome]